MSPSFSPVLFSGARCCPSPGKYTHVGKSPSPRPAGGRGRAAKRVEAPRFLADTRSHSAEVLLGTAAPNTITKSHLAQERADLPVGSISAFAPCATRHLPQQRVDFLWGSTSPGIMGAHVVSGLYVPEFGSRGAILASHPGGLSFFSFIFRAWLIPQARKIKK